LSCCNNYFYTASITRQSDYFERRALRYVAVISPVIERAYRDIFSELSAHALRESRQFLGLVKKKVER